MPYENSKNSQRWTPMAREEAATLANRLLGSYPNLNLHDPEVFLTEMTIVLSRHPRWVGEEAIVAARRESPVFPPSVGAVELACEKAGEWEKRQMQRAIEWEESSQKQIEHTRKWESRPKQTYEEFKAEMADRGLPIDRESRDRARTIETPESVMAKYGLTLEQWNKLPDLPQRIADRNPERVDVRKP